MNDALKTYQISGGIGLARMAWLMAWARVYGDPIQRDRPMRRENACVCAGSASHEYYRIIDRLAAGERP